MAVTLSVVGKFNERDLKKAEDALKKLKKEAQLAASPFSRIGKEFEKAGDTIASKGKTLTTNVTLPLAGIGYAAFRVGAEFETSMNQIQAALGASGTEMTNLEALAKQMGKETVFSANDAASAMLNLAKAGLTPAQISAGALQASMALAATEGLDLGYTAEVVSDAMGAFGLKAQDAAGIADALAGASIASTAGVADLSQALSQASAVAAGAGFSINETTGALALLASNGIKGSDAGTSLKTMLLRLNPATDEAANLMRKLGIDFTNADGSFKSLSEVSAILNDRLGGMSNSQRLATLQTIFGTDAMRAANILTTKGAKGLDKYIEATKDKNAAEKLSEARTKGGAAAIEQMKGSLENAALAIYEAMAPAVTKVAGFIQSLADKFAALPKGTQTFIVAAAGVAAALGPVLLLVGNVTKTIGMMSNAVAFAGMVQKAFKGEVVASAAAQKIAAIATKAWAGIQAAFNAVMSANPIILVGIAIAALVVGIIIAYKKVGWFHDALDAIGRFLKGTLVDAFNAVKNVVGAVVGFIVEHWRGIAQVLLVLTGPIGVAIALFWKFKDNVGNVVSAVVGFFQKIPGWIGTAFRTLGDIITAPFRLAFNGIATLWNNTVGKLSFHAPSWVPMIGGKGFDVPDIPLLAEGGIIRKATLAVVGEAGPEAVVPLKQYNALVDAARQRALIKMKANFDGRSLGRSSSPVKATATDATNKNATATQKAAEKAALAAKKLKQVWEAMSDAGVEALDKLKDHAQSVIDFADQISSTLTSFGSVTGFDTMGEKQTTGENVIASMTTRLNKVKAFGEQLKSLAQLGLNNASLQEIIAAGPDAGSQIAAALLKDGQDAIGQVNTLESQLANVSASIGDLGAQSQFGMSTANARATVGTQVVIEKGAINLTVGAGADPATAAYIKTQVESAVQSAFVQASREVRNS